MPLTIKAHCDHIPDMHGYPHSLIYCVADLRQAMRLRYSNKVVAATLA